MRWLNSGHLGTLHFTSSHFQQLTVLAGNSSWLVLTKKKKKSGQHLIFFVQPNVQLRWPQNVDNKGVVLNGHMTCQSQSRVVQIKPQLRASVQ